MKDMRTPHASITLYARRSTVGAVGRIAINTGRQSRCEQMHGQLWSFTFLLDRYILKHILPTRQPLQNLALRYHDKYS